MSKSEEPRGRIILDNKYAIVVQKYDYALAKIKKGKDGKTKYEPFAYFSNISGCLRKYVNTAVHSDLEAKGDISLHEAVNTIETAVNRSIRVINDTIPGYEVIKTD